MFAPNIKVTLFFGFYFTVLKSLYFIICINNKGNWGQWGNWTSCSMECGGGNQTRVRLCDDHSVANDGAVCSGNSSYTESTNGSGIMQQEDIKACNEQICSG